jgi:tetratricopeptide (TPR) repeat protein
MPNNDYILFELAYTYYWNQEYNNSKIVLEKLTNNSTFSDQAFLILGFVYASEGDYIQATSFLKKAIEFNNNSKASFIAEKKLDEIKIISKRSDGSEFKNTKCKKGFENEFLATKNHYLYIHGLSKKKKITYIIMQYPTLSIQPLRDFFPQEIQKDIIFVSNEETFKKVLEKKNYETLFIDRFGLAIEGNQIFCGNFGHTTIEGSKLIAENTANTIFEYLNITSD